MSQVLKYSVPAALIVVGAIHLIPLSGVIGIERLDLLYGISITNPDLAILKTSDSRRVRAVL